MLIRLKVLRLSKQSFQYKNIDYKFGKVWSRMYDDGKYFIYKDIDSHKIKMSYNNF